MKILDRYILTTFLKTFFSVFIILMLIFVLQAIWLYIRELAGKDLDPETIFKFILYVMPRTVILVIPLTILLVSIMVFGSFAESYEFAAMKSTGISLQRAMSSLAIFIFCLSILTFFFSNNVVPWGEYNFYNLRKEIKDHKPAALIAEGQFNQVGDNFNMKVEKKTGDRGQYLEDVIIHQKKKNITGNFTTIISKTGELKSKEKSNIIQLILYDGYYYDDTPPKNSKEKKRYPFTKSHFESYTMNIDLSNLNEVDEDGKKVTNKTSMYTASGLKYNIDSLKQKRQDEYKSFSTSIYNRTNLETIGLGFEKVKDSVPFNGNVLDLFPLNKKIQIIDLALNSNKSTTQIVTSRAKTFKVSDIWLYQHIIAFHQKFALAIACIILFFVGAPLGALIRKGGIGLPLIIAIVLFLSYHFIGIFAVNSSKDGSISPVFAPWLSTLIMLPLSVFLTRRATADRGIFEFDHILEPIKERFNIGKNKTYEALTITDKNAFFEQASTIKVFSKILISTFCSAIIFGLLYFVFKNNKLPEFATATTQLALISGAIYVLYQFLLNKSINTINKTTSTPVFKNDKTMPLLRGFVYPLFHFNSAKMLFPTAIESDNDIDVIENRIDNPEVFITNSKIFKIYSRIAMVCFCVAIILGILYFVFKNNKLPQIAVASISIAIISGVIYVLYFILGQLVYKSIETSKKNTVLSLISRFFIYPSFHFSSLKKTNTILTKL